MPESKGIYYLFTLVANYLGKFTFSNRFVDEWNMLPVNVISSNTVLSFKIKLDRYVKNSRELTKVKAFFHFWSFCFSNFKL